MKSGSNGDINYHNTMSVILCRVCLCDNATIPIFDNVNAEYSNIPHKLQVCLGEEIQDKPGYPRSLCEECYFDLHKAVIFINKYKESLILLEERLKSLIKEEITDKFDCLDEVENCTEDFIDKKEIVKSEVESNNYVDDNFSTDDAALQLPKIKSHAHSKVNTLLQKSLKPIKTTNTVSGAKNKIVTLSKNRKINTKPNKQDNKSGKKVNTKKAEEKKSEQIKEYKVKPVIICEHCGKAFNSKKRLDLHIVWKHTEKKSIECIECKKTYSSEYALSRHKKRIHCKDKKLCSECGKGFGTTSELDKHYKAVHLKMRTYKMHPCKYCGKNYITVKSLLVHERSVHTGERPAVCSVCDASFVHEEYLTQHMRLHTGETPFKCPVCARGYAQSGNMKSHIKHNHRISQLDELTLKSINPRYLKFMKP